MPPALEQDLLARAKAGDARAFGALVDANQAAVRAFLRRLTGSTADAEDLAQEAFARAFDKLGRLHQGAALKPFVSGIAYKLWLQERRSWFRRARRETAYSAQEDQAHDPRVDLAARRALRAAMAALPPAQRAAVALCIGADFTHAEAAQALDLPLGTVKSHVARGLARLRAAFGVDESQGS
mgnify:FL=1